ncbi:type II toxin-antitoxin system RelE/ParE family toxin [Bradyrhizobium guangzhouense]|uniref:type II toxin-antitoxin system RelE/ParE family toxin n=1 Tax=Bradyrhizobium guangzhouense TaxID=1325095 RepID=UPI001009B004|nr:type II toxin-antitoxin system RelE/ParE family toxin [Bradyrhizobium guangzhouense]RXH08836.1 type II toxin-antitoxin system RelE/ParE family toxin [Bradyrhizobium guangzhouense]
MIQSFANSETGLIWSGRRSRKLPPGNRLEALKADRQGQHSIRINDQWRICFVWDDGGPRDVEIVDYHG